MSPQRNHSSYPEPPWPAHIEEQKSTIDKTPADFARLMGWADNLSNHRKARRWLKRLQVGFRIGRDIKWTIGQLRAAAPELVAEMCDRGMVD